MVNCIVEMELLVKDGFGFGLGGFGMVWRGVALVVRRVGVCRQGIMNG